MTSDYGGLTCRELVELVTDYLENAMAPDDRVRFEQHLLYCEGCRNYLEQMRRTLEAVGALHEEAVPPPAKEKLLEVFRDWKSASGGGEDA